MRLVRLAWGCLIGAAACAPALGAEPADLLVRMSEAARSANYQGVIVYRTQDRLETLRVIHGFEDGVEMERVQALDGTPREVLKRDGRVICLLPKDRRVTVDRTTPKGLFPELSAERVAQIAQVYEFQELGSARVAGRSCRGLAITPRDDFRYGYHICADSETDVPLQVNLIARDGQLLEQMKFTEVEFPPSIPAQAFRSGLDPAAEPSSEPVPAAAGPLAGPVVGPLPWQFRKLPPGFRVTMRELRPTADGKGIVEHVLLSDGLSAVSVFSARREVPVQGFQGQSSMGAVHAFGRLIGRVHVTVVGEAPPQTVRMIGENLPADEAVVAPQPLIGPLPADGERPAP
ncbi:MucB/RseB C-terminal domain-containing protein [Fontimonas sp. SYSU GA230001]|uniref:MucB/RseB C-terminal domain-containing protein n=1 Tax=Fontimonas sp. SYSU GA230001 TaxID=3142450 RepID=UPI0032B510AD